MTADGSVRIRLLIADDHKVVRRGLLGFFDGEDDLDADQRRPDVVLMDLRDDADGRRDGDALHPRPLRRRRDRRPHPFGEDDQVRAALTAGASGYVLKDADADEVAAAVRAAHRGDMQLDAALARRLLQTLPSRRPDEPAAQLTEREREILRLVAAGRSNKEIATELVITERTARTHVSNILSKLELASRTQAALWAVREGVADEP